MSTAQSLYIIKHAPKTLGECAGNDEPREELRKWVLAWTAGQVQKPLLIFGPPGVGKTACVRAVCLEFDITLIETGADELRDKEHVSRLYGLGGASAGLFGGLRLMLFDELDSSFDKGELTELLSILRNAHQPLVLVANDAWDPKLAPVRAYCKLLEFKAVNSGDLKKTLKSIAEKEGLTVDVDAIASNANGDLRGAINDLQAGFLSNREKKKNVFNVVGRIFKTESYGDAMRAANESEIEFDLLYRWLEENITAEYDDPVDVAAAFDALSRSSIFRSRKTQRQYYALMKYEIALAVAGVALAKKARYSKFTRYNFPQYIKTLSAGKASRESLKSASKKALHSFHSSKRDALDSIALIGFTPALGEYLKLEESEEKVLKGLYGVKKPAAQKS